MTISIGNGVSTGNIVTAETNSLTGGSVFTAAGKPVFEVLDGQLVADDNLVPEIKPVDWIQDSILGCDDTYLYGKSSSEFRDFVRINKATRVREVVGAAAAGWGLVASAGIRSICTTSVPGTLLLAFGITGSGVSAMEVWRSTDSGGTWSKVLDLGTGHANSPSTDIWFLSNRNFCEGRQGWYIGEYNVAGSRTDGGANDAVCVWKSVDKGATWTVALTFNVGTHTIRHIHALKSYSGKVYICFGDSITESGIVAWNEVDDISNTAYASLPASSPAWYGSQAYRVVDLLFPGDGYAYGMTDASTTNANDFNNCGWFRYPIGQSGAVGERLDGEILSQKDRSAYYGALLSNGCMVWAEALETGTPAAGSFGLGVYVSNSKRTEFRRAGVLRLDTTVSGNTPPGLLFQDGDTVYWQQGAKALGKGGSGTAVFTLDPVKEYNGVRPDAIWPVYWVDPVGGTDSADTNRGFSPLLPWKTLTYALASNRVMVGGRVLMPAGDSQDTVATACEINFDSTNADTTLYTTVEGVGKNATKHGASATTTPATQFYLRAEATNIELKDIHLTTYKVVSTQAVFSLSSATTAQKMRCIRTRVGGRDIGVLLNTPVVASGAAGSTFDLSMLDSEFVGYPVGAGDLIATGANTPVTVTAINSVFDGGKRAMTMRGVSTFDATDCMFTGQTSEAFEVAAGATNAPSLVRPRIAQRYGIATLLNTGAVSLAGQFKSARHVSALAPAGVFDSASVIDPKVLPKNPNGFEYF